MNANEKQNLRKELKDSFTQALEHACQDTDLKTLDWFSYNPDFFIREEEKLVA